MNASDPTAELSAQARAALEAPETPAYVYSEAMLRSAAATAAELASHCGFRLLYTLKPCALSGVVRALAPYIDGLAASSVFEARLARDLELEGSALHCYSPAFSLADMDEALSLADFLSLNSVSQLKLAASLGPGRSSLGLRVNPQTSFVADARYDPCRPRSKLGVPLSDFETLVGASGLARIIEGVHIHANCESDDLSQLEESAYAIRSALRGLPSLSWINLGGGYYLDDRIDAEPLARAAGWLAAEFGVDVFLEPGTALVQRAGTLVTEALDVFVNDGKLVAVCDASTSHAPEVFEYEFTPPICRPTMGGPAMGGDYPTIIAGRSCLAGDLFGECSLAEPIRAGDRIAIMEMGAYAHSRSSPFNGIPIPSAYLLREDGEFELMSAFGYGEFVGRNGVAAVAFART